MGQVTGQTDLKSEYPAHIQSPLSGLAGDHLPPPED